MAGRPYHSRRNGLGERLPAFCLKVPTGGGKTLLATRLIDLVNAHFRQSRRGLVLWIVPTTQIYNQTLKDRASRGQSPFPPPAAERGRRVYYGIVVDLIDSREEAKAGGGLNHRLKTLTHPALLVVDEIGYLPVSQSTGAGDSHFFFAL